MAYTIEQEMKREHFRVAIFGSARIKKNDKHWKHVYKLAKSIAEEGIDIVTGGGPGLMQAATSGHYAGKKSKNSKGAHSIGLNIKLPREQKFSKHLDVKTEFDRFSERLDHFMSLSNAVVIAPGGVGTMLEFFYTWQLVQVKHICHIPIIFIDGMWEGLIRWIKRNPLKSKFLDPEDLDPIFVAKDVQGAMSILRQAHRDYKKGGDHVCLNIHKYKVRRK